MCMRHVHVACACGAQMFYSLLTAIAKYACDSQVLLDGEPLVHGSPLTLAVEPNDLCVRRTNVTGELTAVTAGERAVLRIFGVDEFGNAVLPSTVRVHGPSELSSFTAHACSVTPRPLALPTRAGADLTLKAMGDSHLVACTATDAHAHLRKG